MSDMADRVHVQTGRALFRLGFCAQGRYRQGGYPADHLLKRTGRRDAVAIKDFGLMNRCTVLAHGCHLSAAADASSVCYPMHTS